MIEDFEINEDEEIALITRFKDELTCNELGFYDTEELETIIDVLFQEEVSLAERAINHALAIYPSSLIFKIKKGILLIEQEEITAAMALLQEVVEEDPIHGDAWIGIAQGYRAVGNSEKTIESYQNALYDDEFLPFAQLELVTEYLQSNAYDKALHYLSLYCTTMTEEDDDESIEEAIELAYDYFTEHEKEEEGLSFFTFFTNQHPVNAIGWLYLGTLCTRQDQFEKANEALDYALSLDDDLVLAYYEKGKMLQLDNQDEEAIDFYLQALDRDDELHAVLLNVAHCYSRVGLYEKSLEILDTITLERLNQWQLHYMMELQGKNYFALRKPTQALVYLEKIPDKEKAKDSTMLSVQMDCYFDIRQEKKAKQIYDTLCEVNPEKYSIDNKEQFAQLSYDRYKLRTITDFEQAIDQTTENNTLVLHFITFLLEIEDFNYAKLVYEELIKHSLSKEERETLDTLTDLLLANTDYDENEQEL